MQTLLIIRGHSGSGKSTFALKKMAEFKQNFTEGMLFHVENDHFLRENGEYHWTVERFQQAKQLAQQQLADALNYCVENPQHDVCIVLSNVGGNAKEIEKVVARATSYGLHTEVYRLQNFFQIHMVLMRKLSMKCIYTYVISLSKTRSYFLPFNR